jgi:hypothetical protein
LVAGRVVGLYEYRVAGLVRKPPVGRGAGGGAGWRGERRYRRGCQAAESECRGSLRPGMTGAKLETHAFSLVD